MDFMKVIDQTVREIKREVNLKVLKVPEIEQKVLDATDDEPWGPHGTALAEIAQATKKFSECQMVMNVLWTRLGEGGRNWRYVYKALAVIEYLVANGSERAVDDIIEHTFQISSLSSFEDVEPSGKDNGINVRKKVENIVALLNDKDKIQEARNKAASNRDKYVGLSSSGITFKSSSASMSSSSYKTNDRYGGFGSTKDGDSFKDSFKERDQSDVDKFDLSSSRSRRKASGSNLESTPKKGSLRYGSKDQYAAAGASKEAANKYSTRTSQSSSATKDDDFDDFDPRGTSTSKTAAVSPPQVDLFGQSLVGDLLDVPVSVPSEQSPGHSMSDEVDLFADAAFVSAPSNASGGISVSEPTKVDLFASQPAASSIDFFAAPDPVVQQEKMSSESVPVTTQAVDPFAAVPLNNFDGSDLFGGFTSQTELVSTESNRNSVDNGSHGNLSEKPSSASKPQPKKDSFQVKSGIWADSLSRGLIDLNISAPKKVNLADVGIVGGLSDITEEKDKGPLPSFYMGRAMGAGSGLGRSGGFTSTTSTTSSDDIFSNLSSQQYQFGGFQK